MIDTHRQANVLQDNISTSYRHFHKIIKVPINIAFSSLKVFNKGLSPKMQKLLQERFLKFLIEQKVDVTVFLKNSIGLEGAIVDFDEDLILLKKNNRTQAIYKHNICSVMPTVAKKAKE